MNTHTRRRDTPQGHHNFGGERCGVPNRKADAVNHPFPNKPVIHSRPSRPQVSLDLDDFENITVSSQPIAPLLPQEHHSDGITETTVPSLSHRLPSEELQMARAIHAKQLMLKEKLWQVEEKIRQKLQRDNADCAGGNEKTSREEGHNRRRAQVQKVQTNTRMPELQFRELARGRDKVMEDRRYDDFKQVRYKQDKRIEDRMRTTKEEQQDASETIQPNRKGNKSTYKVISSKQEVNGELNKSRWHNVKEHTRGKGGDRTDCGTGGKIEKIKYSDVPQKSLQKTPYTGNHRGAGGNQLWDSALPSASRPSHCSGPQQRDLVLMESTEVSLQLFPCKVCNRKFASERLEKHVRICEKVNNSHRQVFNSYVNRTKGSELEQFLKTHSRDKTPEVLKKKNRAQNRQGNLSSLPQARLLAGTSQPKRVK